MRDVYPGSRRFLVLDDAVFPMISPGRGSIARNGATKRRYSSAGCALCAIGAVALPLSAAIGEVGLAKERGLGWTWASISKLLFVQPLPCSSRVLRWISIFVMDMISVVGGLFVAFPDTIFVFVAGLVIVAVTVWGMVAG